MSLKNLFLFFLPLLLFYNANAQCSPFLKEIYSFEIGSSFKYSIFDYDIESGIVIDTEEEYTVADKWWSGDTLFYARMGEASIEKCNETQCNTSYEIINDTVIIIDSVKHSLNACNDSLSQFPISSFHYTKCAVEGDIKEFNKENGIYYSTGSLMYEYTGLYLTETYQKGIGLVKYNEEDEYINKTIKLEYFAFDGDTTYIFKTDIVNVFEPENTSVSIFPSIVDKNEPLQIIANTTIASIEVFDISGLRVPFETDNKTYIKLNANTEGFYLVNIIVDGRKLIQKILLK